ncbi:hypothetical protein [Halomonas sp.]|uniref:glycine-rich domain-containing protein n=1 Tax=Halomonas sp. TaxID=1486246 RepID=UPI003D0D7AA8
MSIPAKPSLTTPPDAPQRTDPPTTFSNKADAYVTWQSGYRDELADAIDWQNTVFTATETEATNAADSATAASNSASASETARDKSQEWAENPEDVEVETGQYSALHHAAKAEGFKDTAEAAAAAAQSAAGLPSLAGNGGKSLKAKEDESGVEWGPGLLSEYQEFTSSGTWNKDPNAQWVYVEAIGGGGSGGSAGGGGGGFNCTLLRAIDVASSETITIGAGGAGTSGVTGSNGGDTTFGSHVTAIGGKAGQDRDGGAGGGGESGGVYGDYIATGGYSSGGGGANLASQQDGANCIKGGAGGGGGVGGAGGASVDGGNGGAGGASGSPGLQPGGGGGGQSAGTSGDGGDGVVRVWQW